MSQRTSSISGGASNFPGLLDDDAAGRARDADLWLSVGLHRGGGDGRPVVLDVRSGGSKRRVQCHLVIYRPCDPDSLEYIPTLGGAYPTAGNDDRGDLGKGGRCSSSGGIRAPGESGVDGEGLTGQTTRPAGTPNASWPGGLRRGRVGHGTALVSPGARRIDAAKRRDVLLRRQEDGGAGDVESDLDFMLRQVSCARALERAFRTVLRDVPGEAESEGEPTLPAPGESGHREQGGEMAVEDRAAGNCDVRDYGESEHAGTRSTASSPPRRPAVMPSSGHSSVNARETAAAEAPVTPRIRPSGSSSSPGLGVSAPSPASLRPRDVSHDGAPGGKPDFFRSDSGTSAASDVVPVDQRGSGVGTAAKGVRDREWMDSNVPGCASLEAFRAVLSSLRMAALMTVRALEAKVFYTPLGVEM